MSSEEQSLPDCQVISHISGLPASLPSDSADTGWDPDALQLDGLSFAEQILAIGRDCAARMPEWLRSIDHADLLYDECGLPK